MAAFQRRLPLSTPHPQLTNCTSRKRRFPSAPLPMQHRQGLFLFLRLISFSAGKPKGGQDEKQNFQTDRRFCSGGDHHVFLYPGVHCFCRRRGRSDHLHILLRLQRQHDPLQWRNRCSRVSGRRDRTPQAPDVRQRGNRLLYPAWTTPHGRGYAV